MFLSFLIIAFLFSKALAEPPIFGWEEDVCLSPGQNNNIAITYSANWATTNTNNWVYCLWYRTTSNYPVIMRWWNQICRWSDEETVSFQPGIIFVENDLASISSDSNNNLHFFWRGKLSPFNMYWLFYRAKLANGNYTNICSLPLKVLSGSIPNDPHIAGSKGDTAHCVFRARWDMPDRIGYAKILPTYPEPTVLDIDTISPMEWGTASCYPHIAVDKNNRIHVVWQGWIPIGTIPVNIFYRMRDTNGIWGQVETLSVFPRSYANYYPRITVDNNGDIHVVWMAYTRPDYHYRLIHRVKKPSGWSEITIFPDTFTYYNCYHPTCAVSPDNRLHIAFYTDGWGDSLNIGRIIRNPNGSWEGPDTVTNFNDNSCRLNPEIVATQEGNIHIFRMDKAVYTNNYYRIFYKRWVPSSGIKDYKKEFYEVGWKIIKEKNWLKIFSSRPVKNPVQITIYNPLGEIKYQAQRADSYFLIDTKNLSAGSYFLKLAIPDCQVIKKIIIY